MKNKVAKPARPRVAAEPKRPSGAFDAAAIREFAELLADTGLTEIEIEQSGQRVRVSRQVTQAVNANYAAPVAVAGPVAAAVADAPAPKRDLAGAVTSPMVGTVYVAPEPGKPPFVKVGDKVKEGDTLLIVEAMKTMNPILAPRGGHGERDLHRRTRQPVEFGQPLVVRHLIRDVRQRS